MRKVKCSKANIALSPIIMYNKTVCKQPKAGEGFMQKIKDFCKRHRLLWLTLLVALAAAAVAAWAGFDLGQRVDNQPVYEIVNDDYTRTVVIPATADAATQDDGITGLYLPVPLKSGQRIYGVRLDLTTHNWAFRQGTLYAALLDADGNAVANGELDCITIKDDTFAAITFDAPYTAPGTADAEADYDLANPNMTLRLWYTPGDDWDVYHLLGLWTDADTSQQMTRRNANGTTDSIVGHPALQYVVNDSGSWSHVISRLLGVLTFAAVVAGFILLTHRAKLWQVVLVCGAVLGVAFLLCGEPFLYIFTNEADVVAAGMERMRIMCFSYCVSAFMDCTIAACRGIGRSFVPTVIVIMGSCVFRVIWVYTIFAHFHTIPSLYLLYIFSWTITAAAEILYFIRCCRRLRTAQPAVS